MPTPAEQHHHYSLYFCNQHWLKLLSQATHVTYRLGKCNRFIYGSTLGNANEETTSDRCQCTLPPKKPPPLAPTLPHPFPIPTACTTQAPYRQTICVPQIMNHWNPIKHLSFSLIWMANHDIGVKMLQRARGQPGGEQSTP